MVVRVKPNSAHIKITVHPTINRPVVVGTVMSFTGGSTQANGELTLEGAAGDTAVGWTAGFIQAQWIETNWCFYRGQHDGDGSMFIQRGRPPSRPAQACRDSVGPVTDIFYDTTTVTANQAGLATDTFPLKMKVTHFDQPSENCNLVETNSLTTQPNFLAEAQLEFHFCTVLTVRDPAGNFHHQASFYWNQRWQASFHPSTFGIPPTSFSIRPLPAGTGAATSGIIMGRPTDKRFSGILTDTGQTQNCNQVFGATRTAVSVTGNANRHEATHWQNFNVTRA